MHFKNGRSAGKGAYQCKAITPNVMMASRLKVCFFGQMTAALTEIMDT
jgi:hypothetical protein